MSNTVLFAGAGASKPFGYPLMQEFFASDKDLSTSLGSCWVQFRIF